MPTIIQTKPDVGASKLSEFFQSTYTVPRYQRSFSWGGREVKQLVEDLADFYTSEEAYYLLGEVILAPTGGRDYEFELIDGQQRTTTLILLFSVCWKRLKSRPILDNEDLENVLSFLENQIGGFLRTGINSVRVKMSGGGSLTALDYIRGSETLTQETRSQEAIAEAFEVIESSLQEYFPIETSWPDFGQFLGSLIDKVYISRLIIADQSLACDFFERVNNRGRDLGETDLLKNRLFQSLGNEDDFDEASDKWDEADRILKAFGRYGSMDFFLRQLLQADLGAKVKEQDLYEKWRPRVSSVEQCKNLISRVESTAPALVNLLSGKTPKGAPDKYSYGTQFFNFTQNLGAKLAAKHLSAPTYAEIAIRLEARAILSLLAYERSQQYENLVPAWAKAIQGMPNDAPPESVSEVLSFDPSVIDELMSIAEVRTLSLRYLARPGMTKRIRYILARSAFEVNSGTAEENFTVNDFLTTSRTVRGTFYEGFDIDHVHASNITNLAELADSLGNLVLLRFHENRSLQDADLEEKALVYAHAAVYLNRALTLIVPQTQQVEAVIHPYRVTSIDSVWNAESVDARFRMYFGIVKAAILDDLRIA